MTYRARCTGRRTTRQRPEPRPVLVTETWRLTSKGWKVTRRVVRRVQELPPYNLRIESLPRAEPSGTLTITAIDKNAGTITIGTAADAAKFTVADD